MKTAKYFLKFLIVFIVSYYLIYSILLLIPIKGKPILKILKSEMIWSRDLFELTINGFPKDSNFDIQFYGSSHTYRSFDPKIFENAGYICYNWGSSSQTPKNTLALIEEYSRNTSNIILEVYPINFTLAGTECAWDMIASPLSNKTILKECLIQNDLRCWQLFSIRPIIQKMLANTPQPSNKSFYKGYAETVDSAGKLSTYQKYTVLDSKLKMQMDYLEKIIRYCKNQNKNLILVCAPVPSKLAIDGEDKWELAITEICAKYSIQFINMLRKHNLSDENHFFDDDHLNKEGVRIFNDTLINIFEKRKLLK
ncbi:MAG: hypothetical protein WCK02_04650 [Bacteroidota bacterium]